MQPVSVQHAWILPTAFASQWLSSHSHRCLYKTTNRFVVHTDLLSLGPQLYWWSNITEMIQQSSSLCILTSSCPQVKQLFLRERQATVLPQITEEVSPLFCPFCSLKSHCRTQNTCLEAIAYGMLTLPTDSHKPHCFMQLSLTGQTGCTWHRRGELTGGSAELPFSQTGLVLLSWRLFWIVSKHQKRNRLPGVCLLVIPSLPPPGRRVRLRLQMSPFIFS